MREDHVRGIAFIFEGTTEKVFYRNLLKWIATQNGCSFEKIVSKKDADIYYTWNYQGKQTLIKVNTVGTITQITNAGKWFINACSKTHKLSWRVYLCYDTDNAQNDISKFYEGDWKLLRTELQKVNADVIDLAASADIEDIMLCDVESICSFLAINVPEKIPGRKGNKIMNDCPSAWLGSYDAFCEFQRVRNSDTLKVPTELTDSAFQSVIQGCGDDSVGLFRCWSSRKKMVN